MGARPREPAMGPRSSQQEAALKVSMGAIPKALAMNPAFQPGGKKTIEEEISEVFDDNKIQKMFLESAGKLALFPVV